MLPLEVPSNRGGIVPSGYSFLLTELYDPKAFITHAALLRQGCPHCAKFLTAASRRSLDRVPVPVWLIILSDQLPIVALVGHYPTNKLMGRGLISLRQLASRGRLSPNRNWSVSGISGSFPPLSRTFGEVIHALLTRAPLYSGTEVPFLARLACVKHAASVQSEPGSNSPV